MLTLPFGFVSSYILVLLLLGGCGKSLPVVSDEIFESGNRLSKLALAGQPPIHRAVVVATVTKDGKSFFYLDSSREIGVAFSRAISSEIPDYRWRGKTTYPDFVSMDGTHIGGGRTEIGIIEEPTGPFWRVGVTGYYMAEVVEIATGEVLGRWHSIPVQNGMQTEITLPIGERFEIVDRQPLVIFGSRTFEVQKIVINPGDTIDVADYDRMYPNVVRPLRIELRDYVPYTPFQGRAEIVGYGWLDIISHYNPQIHGPHQTSYVSRPIDFYAENLSDGKSIVSFQIQKLWSTGMVGTFVPQVFNATKLLTTQLPTPFVAVVVDGE